MNHEITEFLRYTSNYMCPLQQNIDIKISTIIKDINMCIQHEKIIKKHNLCKIFRIDEQTAIKLLEEIDAQIIYYKNNNSFSPGNFLKKVFFSSTNNSYNSNNNLALIKDIKLIINDFSDCQKIALKNLQNIYESNQEPLTHIGRLTQNSSTEIDLLHNSKQANKCSGMTI